MACRVPASRSAAPLVGVVACLWVAGPLASSSALAAERLLWIGASAGTPRIDGIYATRFDDAAGTLSPPTRVAELLNPFCLEMHPKLPVLYAAAAVAAGGRIDAFAIDEASAGLEPRGSIGGFGSLAVDPAGKRLFAVAQLSVGCFPLADDGLPQPAAKNNGQIRHHLDNAGREARKKQPGWNYFRQFEPSATGITPATDGRFVIAADLSLDKLFVDAADAAQATVAPHQATELPTGSGPRRFIWHPSGRFGYALNELDCSVTTLAFDTQAGTLTILDTISTLPEDADGWDRKRGLEQRTFAMDIAAHPSGKFLHVSNVGHDSVATFSIDEATGKPTFVAAHKTQGTQPVAIAMAPGGGHLLVATHRSGGVEVMAIDPKTGRLTATDGRAEILAPACLRFR
jgi:6-phosphogluconolactonase